MKTTGLMGFSSVLILMSGIAVAQEDTAANRQMTSEPATECLNELDRVTQSYDESQLSEPARKEVRQLRESARSLGQRGNQEACDSIVQTISDIAAEDQGRMQEEEGMRALQQATRVTEYQGIIKASAINGAAVRNMQNEELGTVEDTVVDPQSGEISYVVLSIGGFLGVGQRLVAVPWDELRVVEESDGQSYYVVDASRSYLEQRPGLDEQNLPEELSEEWQPSSQQQRDRQ